MKKIIKILLLAAIVLPGGCKDFDDNANYGDMIGIGQDYEPVQEEPTLKDPVGWETTEFAPGLNWYNYENLYAPFGVNQIVNVLEVDLNNVDYKIEVVYEKSDVLSNVVKKHGALAGINGTYEMDASFIKCDGTVYSEVTLEPGHLRYWKHEGALFYNGVNRATIAYGTNESYLASSMPDIISGAPMLIDDYNPVGETFIGDVSGIDLNSLEYEDYRRHQGVRHPRTAVALTETNRLLLITIDGRWDLAAGATAKEVTQFLTKYFQPQYALNLDGGGSTTMYIDGIGVVNYPCDNGIFDHEGERSLSSFILIKRTADEEAFAGGSGTQTDPYIITKPMHLNNMHTKVDWNKAATTPLYFRMEADVDMSGFNWTPLNTTDPYDRHMHFDGNGHIIKNLTSKGYSYAGFAGVVCGSVRNLGLVDAVVESTNGAGIIGGYVGLQTPTSTAKTGIVENCFTSGSVSGTNGVGGIAGNVGKPINDAYSMVQNCYSTAKVTSINATGNSRVGNVAGVVYTGGAINYCYSAGTVLSMNFGAGGVVGYSDANVIGCVALNTSVSNANSGNLGRISAVMGPAVQGDGCYALAGMTLDNAGTPKSDSDLKTGTVNSYEEYDGVTKTGAELSRIATYTGVGWNTSGAGQVWASQTSAKGYPILQWQLARGDYDTMGGHNDSPVLDDGEEPVEQDGSEEFPYILKTKADLMGMRNLFVPDQYVYFELGADIDLAGEDWVPLNTADPYGNHMHFDGKGHIIKNLTSKGYSYAGFAGVVCGSVRNLGLLDAVVESTNGAGIIGGYVGLNNPGSAAKTGIVENCFTSGSVSGTNGVGGIAGNIGKPINDAYSMVQNCYSTAKVTATNASGNARVGNIAGVIYTGAVINYCYSAGEVISKNTGAGGIVGYSDANVIGCVALNTSVSNANSGNLGRISGVMGGTPAAQGEACYALEGMTLDNGGTPKSESDLKTGTVNSYEEYDGVTKTSAELRDIATYTGIGWKTSGEDRVWASQLNAKGYPVLQWQFARGDYDTLSGHE